jgi:hypothetical protein
VAIVQSFLIAKLKKSTLRLVQTINLWQNSVTYSGVKVNFFGHSSLGDQISWALRVHEVQNAQVFLFVGQRLSLELFVQLSREGKHARLVRLLDGRPLQEATIIFTTDYIAADGFIDENNLKIL